MRSRLLLNLCLLLAVAGLALFLFLSGNKETGTGEVALTGIKPETINRIRILRNGQDEISFIRQSGVWMMQRPLQLEAGALRIDTLLKLLSAHSYEQFPARGVQLSHFRLDRPQVSIEYNDTRIDFGDTSPLAERRYVLVNNTVHIINDVLFQQLQAPATFFLNTRLLPEHTSINAILLPGHAIRRHEGVWGVDPAVATSGDKLVELVNAWRIADAISISKYEDTAQHDHVRIELEKQDAIEFVIVHEPPQLILARPDLGIQYHLGDYDAERMFLKTSTEQNHGAASEK